MSQTRDQPYHVVHKLPPGDSPYVRAKHVQLVEKDPEAAIVLFWKAINAGDRVDSALKDMAVVLKQQDRADEAVEAIKSFRHLCSKQAQESLDNVLIDLYKGNLGWAYMQKGNYTSAEVVYRKAQLIDPDANKACNLSHCLIKQARYTEARSVLEDVLLGKLSGSTETKTINRVKELLQELEPWQSIPPSLTTKKSSLEDAFLEGLDDLMNQWTPYRSRRLPIFEEISPFRDQLAC
ncbi:TPR REGION domain-containing protein [Citrus sinensis]|nr:TPR REGION domain-containing protein [Citrus sinensis]